MNMTPIPGYRPQSNENLARVSANKAWEERVLRILDELDEEPSVDKSWLAVGRTYMEMGFMCINRAVMQPERVDLPEDRSDDSVSTEG